MQAHGDTAAVVGDADPTIGEQCHRDGVGVTGESLVDRVVHDLVDEVVQTTFAGGTDVHPGALTDRLQAFKDGDRASVVRQVEILLPEDTRRAAPRTTSGAPDPRAARNGDRVLYPLLFYPDQPRSWAMKRVVSPCEP